MTAPKLQRWLDLLATLLARRVPAAFIDLARDVPAYLADGSVTSGAPSDTLKRMFERDKLELRELGIPIVSVGDEGDEETAYQLRTKDFYLPYLAIMSERGLKSPDKVDRYGYHSLTTLAFEADELEAIREGAQRVIQVGDPVMTENTRQALQKLAFDLPLGATLAPAPDGVILPATAQPDPKLLTTLGDALFRRKRVVFSYASPGAVQQTNRDVEPYGLFFLNGHWYLAARDLTKSELRNFRVGRMSAVSVNASRAGTPDYDIAAGFVLRDHARSRQAWEIGDGDSIEAVVEFRGNNGAVLAASALGRPHESEPSRRRFDVRRSDTFLRWLLAFGGDAIPVEPCELAVAFKQLVADTRAVYAPGRSA